MAGAPLDMPMYQILTQNFDGSLSERKMGFYRDSGALAYAQRFTGSGKVEVWRDAELIGSFNSPDLIELSATN